MANEIKLTAQLRTVGGTPKARSLRRTGKLPAVVYGEGRPARSIELDAHGFGLLLHRHTAENILLDLQIGSDAPAKVLLREVQHHPLTGDAVHADFVEVSLTRKLRVHCTVVLTGVPKGVSEQGGMLDQVLRAIEIEGLPNDIVETITVDVSGLALGDSLRASGLVLPAGIGLVTPAEIVVAHVVTIRAEEAPAAAEAAATGETPKEPEVLREKKKADEEKAKE